MILDLVSVVWFVCLLSFGLLIISGGESEAFWSTKSIRSSCVEIDSLESKMATSAGLILNVPFTACVWSKVNLRPWCQNTSGLYAVIIILFSEVYIMKSDHFHSVWDFVIKSPFITSVSVLHSGPLLPALCFWFVLVTGGGQRYSHFYEVMTVSKYVFCNYVSSTNIYLLFKFLFLQNSAEFCF